MSRTLACHERRLCRSSNFGDVGGLVKSQANRLSRMGYTMQILNLRNQLVGQGLSQPQMDQLAHDAIAAYCP
jgi:hypothetical protein